MKEDLEIDDYIAIGGRKFCTSFQTYSETGREKLFSCLISACY